MDYKTADLLIKTYKDATQRTRGVFMVLQFVSIIFIIGYFNHRYTWLRRNVEVFQIEKGEQTIENLSTVKNNLDFYYKVYTKSKELGGDLKFIDFDLVGLEIYIEDLPLLGAIALMIIMTWFFYLNRRESGIINEISNRISKEPNPNMIEYLFYGTSFNLIFNTIKTIDNEEVSFAQLMAVKIRRTLLFLPAILLGVILFHDIYETFLVETPYRGLTVWEYFGETKWISEEGYWARAEIIFRIVVTLPLLYYSLAQSKALKTFSLKDAEKWKIIQDKFLKARVKIEKAKKKVNGKEEKKKEN